MRGCCGVDGDGDSVDGERMVWVLRVIVWMVMKMIAI